MEAVSEVTEDTSREWEVQRRPKYDPRAAWERHALFTSGETHLDLRQALEYFRTEDDAAGRYAWRVVEVVTRVQRIVRGW